MSDVHHIYLIPGFFGFGDLGGLTYFQHVTVILEEKLRKLGIQVQLHTVRTIPTGSIRRRALRLLQEIEATSQTSGPIHLIGHSTGGLDARLLVTPGVTLDSSGIEPQVVERIRSVITINTPHHGTPIAGFFTTLYGKRLLYLLSLVAVAVVSGKQGPILAAALNAASRLDDILGLNWTALDVVSAHILEEFSPQTQEAIRTYLDSILTDQGALLQLNPEAMDLFNAAVTDHPDITYLSYAAAAPYPGIAPLVRCLPIPGKIMAHFVYRLMFAMVARPSSSYPWPSPSLEHCKVFQRGLGFVPTLKNSDGVVPTLSMPWGKLMLAQSADHLDVVGHFDPGPELKRNHFDWLPSGANFQWSSFATLWTNVARQIASL